MQTVDLTVRGENNIQWHFKSFNWKGKEDKLVESLVYFAGVPFLGLDKNREKNRAWVSSLVGI